MAEGKVSQSRGEREILISQDSFRNCKKKTPHKSFNKIVEFFFCSLKNVF